MFAKKLVNLGVLSPFLSISVDLSELQVANFTFTCTCVYFFSLNSKFILKFLSVLLTSYNKVIVIIKKR